MTTVVPLDTIKPGTRVEAVISGVNADGTPITRKTCITVDRTPWYAGASVVLSDGQGVTPTSLRILGDHSGVGTPAELV